MKPVSPPTAGQFIKQLKALSSRDQVDKVARFFRGDDGRADDNRIMGVSPGKVFPLAKKFMQLPLSEVDELLDSRFYEVRLGAVSIMDFQARAKSTGAAHRKALFDLYMKRHDRINTWDLVDRAAPFVVGGYLADKPRDVLYRLARSKYPSERRTAIVSTYYFIRAGDVADAFRISEVLAADGHDLVQKATGSWLREAGKKDRDKLVAFLERHARRMPRTMLRYATEKLDKTQRDRFLGK
jgi:3-methyladenine DNA glycosylase AlkD